MILSKVSKGVVFLYWLLKLKSECNKFGFFLFKESEMKRYIFGLFLCINLLRAEGFIAGTSISMQRGLMQIEHLMCGDVVDNGCYITHVMHDVIDNYIKMRVGDCIVCPALDQKFYVQNKKQWVNAIDLAPLDELLCHNGTTLQVNEVIVIYEQQQVYILSVKNSHIFYVTPHEIVTHNMEPTGGVAVALLSVFCPPAGAALFALETVVFGAVGIGTYCVYREQKKRKKIVENLVEIGRANSYSGGKDPKDEDDEEKHPYGIYEESSYHHKNSKGKKGRSPKNGQRALDNSFEIEGCGRHRIALDGDEFVVLMFTSFRKFHGHVRVWDLLDKAMQNTLKNQGLVSSGGKIIKKLIGL